MAEDGREEDGRGNEDKGKLGGSFDARLAALRGKHGLDVPPVGEAAAEGTGNALGVGLRVGVELVSALAVSVLAIGWALDRWLHSLPLFLVIFLLLGGAAGVLNVWRVVSPAPARPRR